MQVQFPDVLDLVPQSGVRVADVPVGRVDRIKLGQQLDGARHHGRSTATCKLPANATAAIQQTSLLGEKYVELAPPTAEQPQGRLPTAR